METRRFILALSISLAVFIVYLRFFAPQEPQKPVAPETAKQEAAKEETTQTRKSIRPELVAAKIEQAAIGRNIVVETDLVKAVVNTAGGVITGWELKEYLEADKTEVGIGAMYKKITGQAKKEEKPKKELGNVQLLSAYAEVDS